LKSRPSSPPRRPATARHAEGLLRVEPAEARGALSRIGARLPALRGRPIRVGFRPGLWACRGRLVEPERGVEVHAAAFLRRRRILLEQALLAHPDELARILVHELFHFVWVRLGNPARRSWEALLSEEIRQGVRGELGYSAEGRKRALRPADFTRRSRRWREYACESFCDTAAWRLAGARRHEEFTLARAAARRRAGWFERLLGRAPLPV